MLVLKYRLASMVSEVSKCIRQITRHPVGMNPWSTQPELLDWYDVVSPEVNLPGSSRTDRLTSVTIWSQRRDPKINAGDLAPGETVEIL